MSPRLCGCTFIHPCRTPAQGMAQMRELGFARVDVGVGGGNANFDPVQVAEHPLHFAGQLREEADRLELVLNECFLLNFGWPINSPDAALRRRTEVLFAELCLFADRAEFASILVIPGPVHAELGAEASLDLSADALRALVDIASAAGVRLNVEADMDSCANTPERALRLCKQSPGLSLTLDYSHFVCQGITLDRVNMLHPFVRHMHVRQAAPGRIATDLDEGIIDYPAVLARLHAAGYCGVYCIEYLAMNDSPAAAEQARSRTVAAAHYFNDLLQECANAKCAH